MKQFNLGKMDLVVMFVTPFVLRPLIADNYAYLITCMLSGLLWGVLKK